MKKAILLTAIAGTFALSSFAGENPTIAPAKFKGETATAAWKTYILLEQTSEKTTFFGGNGIATPYAADAELVGWNLTYGGSPTYLRDENGTKYGWKYVINTPNVTSSPDNYYEFTSDADAQPFELRTPEHRENGAYQLVASYNEKYSLLKYYETKLGYLSHNGFMSRTVNDQSGKADLYFISQAQMDFHNKAQEIANFLNGATKDPAYKYTGVALQPLVDAIQTEGTNWRDQLNALIAADEKLHEAYAAIDTIAQSEYWMGGANPYSITFQVKGFPGEPVECVKDSEPLKNIFDEELTPNFDIQLSNNGVIGADSTCTVTINFTPNSLAYGSVANKDQYGAQFVLTVAGVEIPAPVVYGADPKMSFTKEWNGATEIAGEGDATYSYTVNIPATTTEKITVPFYAYGFFGQANTVSNMEVTLSPLSARGNTESISVIASNSLMGNNLVDDATDCGFEITFNPSELGIAAGSYILDCGIEGVEPLVLNVNACESAIDVLEDEVRFGNDAAEKVITIAYSNFQGVNDGKHITFVQKDMMAEDPSISIQFIDANGNTSNELHGTGTIQAIIKYDPSKLDPKVGNPEYTYIFSAIDDLAESTPNADANDEIVISRCNPYLEVVKDPRLDPIYTMKEDLEEHTFEVRFAHISAPYDLSDMIVRTETDIFIVKDVIYSGNAEEGILRINVQYNPHVKNTKYTDRLTVSCGSVEAGCDLIGDPVKAVSYGTNGIEEIETETVNGAAYNVAGQQVKATAKGLVIMNGNKILNK